MSNHYFNSVFNLGTFQVAEFQNALTNPGLNQLYPFPPFCNQGTNQGLEYLQEQKYHHVNQPPVPATNFVLDNNVNKNILSRWQQQELEACFSNNHYPGKEVRLELSSKLGISENRLHIWFQNRRAKQRRLEHTRKRPGRPSLANPPKNCSGVPIQDEILPIQKKARINQQNDKNYRNNFIQNDIKPTYLNQNDVSKKQYGDSNKPFNAFSPVKIKVELQSDENCLTSENDSIESDIDVNEPPTTSTPIPNKKLINFAYSNDNNPTGFTFNHTTSSLVNRQVNQTKDSGIFSEIRIDSKKRKRCDEDNNNDGEMKTEPKKKLSFSIRSILGEL